MQQRSYRRIAAYIGVFAASLIAAVALYAFLGIIDAPETFTTLYLQPGISAEALLYKIGPLYTALLGRLDHIFANATVLGLSLGSSALWLPIALAFVIWACLFSALAVLAHGLLTRRTANAA